MNAERTPAVGDPVLVYGEMLNVTRVEERSGNTVVHCENVANRKARDAAVAREREVRAIDTSKMTLDEKMAHAESLVKAQQEASDALFKFGLRANLLSWWDEKSCWVSEGRILSHAQVEEIRARFGQKPKPQQHRELYLMLEAVKKNG